jgi:hypothetical protein
MQSGILFAGVAQLQLLPVVLLVGSGLKPYGSGRTLVLGRFSVLPLVQACQFKILSSQRASFPLYCVDEMSLLIWFACLFQHFRAQANSAGVGATSQLSQPVCFELDRRICSVGNPIIGTFPSGQTKRSPIRGCTILTTIDLYLYISLVAIAKHPSKKREEVILFQKDISIHP